MKTNTTNSSVASAPAGVEALFPIMAALFIGYLMIGLAMPIIPLHVHQDLGLDNFAVGLLAGGPFLASLLSRMWAGYHADSRGAKRTMIIGLLIAAASGLFYLASLPFVFIPWLSASILLVGRLILGVGESFIITGALLRGLSLLGVQNSGKVMAWIGSALYAAYAIGAPLGLYLFTSHGFGAIAVVVTLIPFATLVLVAPLRHVAQPPRPTERPAFRQILASVWLPGLGAALCSVGFASITSFIPLLFAEHDWNQVWVAFTALSLAFILGRLAFGHLPDRIGGAKVALFSILVEAAGQAFIGWASSPIFALAGVTLSGLGYSLIYPAFGVEALRQADPQSRGLIMGAYTSFLDLSLGLSGPLLGLVGNLAGLNAIFFASMLIVMSSVFISFRYMNNPISGLRTQLKTEI